MTKKISRPDAENPEWTREEMRAARPAHEVFPEAFRDVGAPTKRRRGERGPQKAPTKRLVTLRIQPDAIETYKKGGAGWQARMDADLAAKAITPKVIRSLEQISAWQASHRNGRGQWARGACPQCGSKDALHTDPQSSAKGITDWVCTNCQYFTRESPETHRPKVRVRTVAG